MIDASGMNSGRSSEEDLSPRDVNEGSWQQKVCNTVALICIIVTFYQGRPQATPLHGLHAKDQAAAQAAAEALQHITDRFLSSFRFMCLNFSSPRPLSRIAGGGVSAGPSEEDLMAIANAVREVVTSDLGSKTMQPELGRRGHLRVLPSN